jgi:hypothetical protein
MLAGGVYASSSRLVHDANYYILEAQHAEQWMAYDKVVDKKTCRVSLEKRRQSAEHS